jgi:hypothetical protein
MVKDLIRDWPGQSLKAKPHNHRGTLAIPPYANHSLSRSQARKQSYDPMDFAVCSRASRRAEQQPILYYSIKKL